MFAQLQQFDRNARSTRSSGCYAAAQVPSSEAVKWAVAALTVLGIASAGAAAQAPLYDSVRLNIGLNCRWERRCIAAQTRAMQRALAYVRTRQPSHAAIHLCNRNATRGRFRVDWVGFDNCIRNVSLRRR